MFWALIYNAMMAAILSTVGILCATVYSGYQNAVSVVYQIILN